MQFYNTAQCHRWRKFWGNVQLSCWLQCTHLLMATSSRIMHHIKKLKSSQIGFLNMTMSSLYSWPPQSPDLNPIEHLWDVVEREIRIMDVQPTNLQQLRDAIMSIWTKISEECFQHLVESMPWRIKVVLKSKVGPTRTSKVYLIKWPASVSQFDTWCCDILYSVQIHAVTNWHRQS